MILGHRDGHPRRHRRRPLPHDQPRHVQERPLPERRLGRAPDRDDRAEEARRPAQGDAAHGLRLHRLRPGHLGRLAPQRLRLQGDDLPRRPRIGVHGLRHRRLGRGHLHLRLVPQGRPLRVLRRADARGPRGQGKPAGHRRPDPRPGRPVHPVRRLQQAAPDPVHHADRRAPRRGRRASRFREPRPGRLQPGRAHLHRLPRPGLPAPPLRLPEGRTQGLPGLRARPQAPRRPSALRLGRSPGVRSLRAGRQGPPGAVDVPVQGRRPAHRLRLSRRSSPSPARNSSAS